MKFATMPVILIATTILFGCGEKTYTADYLLTDKAKRQEILADCKANKQSTENCNNANQAQSAINLQLQTKATQYKLLGMKQDNEDKMARMVGASQSYQQETKMRKEQMEKLKAEMEALAKQ